MIFYVYLVVQVQGTAWGEGEGREKKEDNISHCGLLQVWRKLAANCEKKLWNL